MADQEMPDILKLKETIDNTKWVTVTRRIGGHKREWFLWRLRKEKISHHTPGPGIHGEVIQVDENQVLPALRILDEHIGEFSIFTEAGVAWDDLPNDHPTFKGQADDISPPGTKLEGWLFDYETGKLLGGSPFEEE